MQEHSSASQQRWAREVYDHVVANPGHIHPVDAVAFSTGLTYHEVVQGMHWALREICPQTGIYLASQRGPYGGYFVAETSAEAAADESRWMKEMWTHTQKVMAKNEARRKGKMGNRAALREIQDTLTATSNAIENGLEKFGEYVGHVAKDRAADEAAKAP